jgi:hypothetical protein
MTSRFSRDAELFDSDTPLPSQARIAHESQCRHETYLPVKGILAEVWGVED